MIYIYISFRGKVEKTTGETAAGWLRAIFVTKKKNKNQSESMYVHDQCFRQIWTTFFYTAPAPFWNKSSTRIISDRMSRVWCSGTKYYEGVVVVTPIGPRTRLAHFVNESQSTCRKTNGNPKRYRWYFRWIRRVIRCLSSAARLQVSTGKGNVFST